MPLRRGLLTLGCWTHNSARNRAQLPQHVRQLAKPHEGLRMKGLRMITYPRRLWLKRPPERNRLSSSGASFMRLLLSAGLILWAVLASAQELRPGGKVLSDALPPTIVVGSSPAPSPSSSASPQSPPAETARLAENPKPTIIWHRVHGRWHWHCLAHCSKYRRHHESPDDEVTEFDDPNGR